MTGWVRVDRATFEHKAFRGPADWGVWLWLISQACWKQTEVVISGERRTLERGQLSYSIRFLSEKFGLSKNGTQGVLKRFQKWDLIELGLGTGQTIITICNYDKYQDAELHRGRDGDAAGTTRGRERDATGTKKNNKQDNKEPESTVVDSSLGEGQSAELFPIEPAPKKGKTKSASRIPEDWVLSEKGRDFALKTGLTFEQIEWQAQKFLNHWIQSNSKTALKQDWEAAWRTWVMRTVETGTKGPNSGQPADSTSNAISNMLSKGFLDDE